MANTEQYVIKLVISGTGTEAVATIDNVNKKLTETEKAADGAGKSTKTLSQQWGAFKDVAMNLVGAAGLVAAGFNQVYAAGRAAQSAEITFNQVSGGVDNANASLARMRDITGGVIDDMTLMKGANSLLVTGIAQTNEQAEELVNLGARLSSVMGVDAAEGIANLNSALLNNSFMRLDTLGISAARVRERVNELKESGLDMSAAFSQAVLEIGGQTLEDLGMAADVANTAVARLSTRVTNLGQDMAEWAAGGMEQAATSLEQLLALMDVAGGGTGGSAVLEAEQAAASAAAAEYQKLLDLANEYQALSDMAYQTATGQAPTQVITTEQVIGYAQASPEQFAAQSTGTYFAELAASGNYEQMRDILSEIYGMDFSNTSIENLNRAVYDLDTSFLAVANAQAGLEAQTEQTNAAIQEETIAMRTQSSVLEAQGIVFNRVTSEMNDIIALNNDLNTSFAEGTFTNSSGMVFFDAEQLAEVRNEAEAITDEYQRLKQLGEDSEFTLVSEEEVERAREIAESANQTADQAERNARAWETASLAMIAGATGGGRQNEFNQMVLAQIEDPELRAQAEQQLNLQSGVETANTQVQAYAAELSAALINEFGSGRGTQLGLEVYNAMEEGIRLGFEGEELQNYIEQEVGYAIGTSAEGGTSVGGTEVQIQAGEGYQAVAARTGYSVEELMAATGGRMLMAGEVITVGDNQLIALNENTPIGTVQSAGANVLGAIGANAAQAPTNQPMADYTYYDPATGQYSYSNNAAPIAPETAEATTQVADDMLTIETSVANIAATDVSATFDPLVSDVDEAVAKVDEFQGKMTTLTDADWSIEVPIAFVFNTQTAELLARNTQVVETVRLVLDQLSVPHG